MADTATKKIDNLVTIEKKDIIFYSIIAVVFAVSWLFFPQETDELGAFVLVPVAVLLSCVFYTKRVIESLFVAAALTFVIGYKADWLYEFYDATLKVMMEEDMAWLYLVIVLIGSLVAVIEKAGGPFAFGEWVATKAKNKKTTLIWAWILGCFVFIDDYVNALTIGASITPVSDKHKTSREMLAYVADSTAAPVCALLPFSTWAAFVAGLIESEGFENGMAWFIRSIPYSFYSMVAVILVPLVILGIVPVFGPMKKAEKRAMETGQLAPEGSEKMDIRGGKTVNRGRYPKIINFLLPMFVMVAASIYFGGGFMSIDLSIGGIATLIFLFFFYIPQRIMTIDEFYDAVYEGAKNMMMPLLIVTLAFIFAEGADRIGFIQYCIDVTITHVSPAMLPLTIFAVFAATEFVMGLNWGMYVVAIPIVLPVAVTLGVNPAICIAAVVSAGIFGSHICFYSDATVVTSLACGCDNYRHGITQAPFGLLAAGIAAIMYLVLGLTLY